MMKYLYQGEIMMKQVNFYDLKINDNFWSNFQNKMFEKTVWAVYDRFYETGRITTMDCEWTDGKPNKPNLFWGSDVFKWVEGAAYLLEYRKDEKLISLIDDIVRRIEKGVREDGYYNSYYNSTNEPIFSNRSNHELYSLGHMIEAAIALDHATGDNRLLNIAVKNVGFVNNYFCKEDAAAFVTPGHEEIELALFRLYHYTGNKDYYELAKFFLEKRGNNDKDGRVGKAKIIVQDFPIREQHEAMGHAVRATYLYSAMVDYVNEEYDKDLMQCVKDIFNDIYEKKMYITGGVGSSSCNEAFSVPYHLPNRDAYAETCAAIGLALFSGRMQNTELDSRFGDAVERAIYNGVISGIDLDGTSFFYSNPLAIDLSLCNADIKYQPKTVRQKIFDCSCCPPNILRFISSIGNLVYGLEEDTLYVHQYIANSGNIDGCSVELITDYPNTGKVTVFAKGKKLALRKPMWCDSFSASAPCTEKNGYLFFETDNVSVDFSMTPKFYISSDKVHDNAGRVALTRGPIVYCAEQQDQKEDIFSISICTGEKIIVENELFGGLPVITVIGKIIDKKGLLYQPLSNKSTTVPVRFIPYFSFANCGECNMQVWIPSIN